MTVLTGSSTNNKKQQQKISMSCLLNKIPIPAFQVLQNSAAVCIPSPIFHYFLPLLRLYSVVFESCCSLCINKSNMESQISLNKLCAKSTSGTSSNIQKDLYSQATGVSVAWCLCKVHISFRSTAIKIVCALSCVVQRHI